MVELNKGTLVQYAPVASRWYFATVKESRGDRVRISLFTGEEMDVRAEDVAAFHAVLAERSRVLSLRRTQLANAFFQREMERLPAERLRLMQKALRRHGFRFEPTEWSSPETVIQIRRDGSVTPSRTSRDAWFTRLLPRWLAADRRPESSRDPLGLQAQAERHANQLLPGVNVFTTRAGYYGFLCWAIETVNTADAVGRLSRRELLHRLERALVLAEFVHHGSEDASCRLIGQRAKTAILNSADGDRYRLPERIVKNQTTTGALRLYATSMVSLGFVTERMELAINGQLPWELTAAGRKLAAAFQRRVPAGFVEFAWGDRARAREDLRAWGGALCFSQLYRLGSFRDAFLDGLLLADSTTAEVRYGTVRRLFRHRLLRSADVGEGEARSSSQHAEDESSGVEEIGEPAGLSNLDVILEFLQQEPQDAIKPFQEAAVFECASLGLLAAFNHLNTTLEQAGRTTQGALVDRLRSQPRFDAVFGRPRDEAARRCGTVAENVQRLLDAEGSVDEQAVHGMALLLSLLRSPVADAVRDTAMQDPAMESLEVLFAAPDRALGDTYGAFLARLVEHHQRVSAAKNKQRWCFMDGDTFVRDDSQRMGIGLHAMRFPQLHSLLADMRLTREDLHDV